MTQWDEQNRSTYPPKGLKAICMSLSYDFALSPGVTPVAVHDETDMLRDRSEGYDMEKDGGEEGMYTM